MHKFGGYSKSQVILSDRRESKDLRTYQVLSRRSVRRSFDALRLLRMTSGGAGASDSDANARRDIPGGLWVYSMIQISFSMKSKPKKVVSS